MVALIRFPKVGPGVEQATVGQWRKAEGDIVEKGEALVEMITDKATFDLEAETEGVLLRIVAPEKSTIPVDYVLAVVGEPGETVPDVTAENERAIAAQKDTAAAAWTGPGRRPGHSDGRIRATPSARRLARQEGLSLEDLASSVGTVIKEEHVLAFLEQQRKDPGNRR